MILADSGFWLALANRRDVWHQIAVDALRDYAGETLACTWPVATETAYLIGERVGPAQQLKFVQDLGRGCCDLIDVPHEALSDLHTLMLKYRDLPMDLADASMVWLAGHLGEGRILSTDLRDFGAYRWKNRKPFRNLLLIG